MSDVSTRPFARHDDGSLLRLAAALGLALLVHALVVGAIALASHLGWLGHAVARPPENVSLVSLTAAQWSANRVPRAPSLSADRKTESPAARPAPVKREAMPRGQVVDVAAGNDQRPAQSKYLAEHDNTVARQTRSRHQTLRYRQAMPTQTSVQPALASKADPGGPVGEHGNGGTANSDLAVHDGSHTAHFELPAVQKREEVAMAQTAPHGEIHNQTQALHVAGNAPQLRVTPGELAALDDDVPASRGHAGAPGDDAKPSAGDPSQVSGAPSADRLDLPDGDATWLNSRAFQYAQFFNRIKQRVGEQWHASEIMRRRGIASGPAERVTVLDITLDTEGRLVSTAVAQSSGLPALDEEAVAAFERAQPFSNPPRPLFGDDGKLRFAFSFYLESLQQGGGFRLIRSRN